MGLYFLIFAKPKHISNIFLGLLLFTLSIRIGKSVFFYFNPDLAFIYLQIGLSACFFIGPFLYFYLTSLYNESSNSLKWWKIHIAILLAIISVVGIILPFEKNIPEWRCYIINGIYFQWLIYIIASGFSMKHVLSKFFLKKEKPDARETWVLSIFIGVFFIWFAYVFWNYTSYILGALSFSLMLYLLILLLVFNKKINAALFGKPEKYMDKKIEEPEAKLLLGKLRTLMEEEELFNNPDLKLADVAKRMNITSHRLSQLLNDNLGKNFPAFINEYRVSKAKEMLCSIDNFTLEAIGLECGFNSKSTFYATFKKLTGSTPAIYKNKMLNKS